MTICNLNQVEASFLKEHEADGNRNKKNLLFNEFIKGRQGNLSKEDEIYINETKEKLSMDLGWTFLGQSRQLCQNLFIRVSFPSNMESNWLRYNGTNLLPNRLWLMLFSCASFKSKTLEWNIRESLSYSQGFFKMNAFYEWVFT